MKKGILIGLVLPLLMVSIATAQEVPEEACCPSRIGGLGIGAWFHYEMICASLRHWPSETRALELNFCAPSRGERLQLFIKGLNNLSDGCFLDSFLKRRPSLRMWMVIVFTSSPSYQAGPLFEQALRSLLVQKHSDLATPVQVRRDIKSAMVYPAAQGLKAIRLEVML